MNVARGDVVLVVFPFASGQGHKLRPAIVVQGDRLNLKLSSTIIAAVTSNTAHTREPTQVLIDPSSPEGATTGLLLVSSIKCENLATIETRLIQRKIGSLHVRHLKELDAAIVAALELK